MDGLIDARRIWQQMDITVPVCGNCQKFPFKSDIIMSILKS